jgi:hypothetical protein
MILYRNVRGGISYSKFFKGWEYCLIWKDIFKKDTFIIKCDSHCFLTYSQWFTIICNYLWWVKSF